MEMLPIRRALISVSDKSGLEELALSLSKAGVEMISTGGTAAFLRDKGFVVTMVADITGFPEIMEGRVKTLHPKIHGALLARRDDARHVKEMEEHAIRGIDLAIINLYPFQATIERGAAFEEAIENIDIGGPAMIRASAKNHDFAAIVTDPADYGLVGAALRQGGFDRAQRRALALKAFAHTAAYDSAIAQWLAAEEQQQFPEHFFLTGRLAQRLRYGENPHQGAALYLRASGERGLPQARFLQGKELSYNNLADGDAALGLLSEFTEAACVIVKHANPCGVAIGASIEEAYAKALEADPISAFGGIVALNRPVSASLAEELAKIFLEVVIAPDFADAALEQLRAKKNLRLLRLDPVFSARRLNVKTITGGFLVQERDILSGHEWRCATQAQPDRRQMADLAFAEKVVKHVGSNAIVIALSGQTLGIGAGQMSRIDAVTIALSKAGDKARGAVLASDAFFPFPDSILAAREASIAALVQPGGAQRDQEVIDACDQAGIAMMLTGYRHFKH